MAAKRFEFFSDYKDGEVTHGCTIEMRESADGDYIRFDDYQKLLDIIKDMSLTVDDYGVAQGTHYIENGKIMPKGSFIALVQRAKDLIGE